MTWKDLEPGDCLVEHDACGERVYLVLGNDGENVRLIHLPNGVLAHAFADDLLTVHYKVIRDGQELP